MPLLNGTWRSRLKARATPRRSSAAVRFAQVKGEAVTLGHAGGHGAKRAAVLLPRDQQNKNQAALAAVFFAATFFPAAGTLAARGSNSNITLPSFLS